jgi:guanylate kinase
VSETKFLLLLGPSGAGKSTIMWALQEMDNRYVYISPYTNRPLREGETDKIHISDAEMDHMTKAGEFLVINEKFNWRYATPRSTILDAFAAHNYPLLDWPVDRLDIMQEAFGDRLYVVYIAPPSITELGARLANDNRDSDGARLRAAMAELKSYHAGEFSSFYDLEVVSDGKVEELAARIHTAYLGSFG